MAETMTETTEHEITYAANTTTATTISGASDKSGVKMVKKKGAKSKLTAKEKKERNVRQTAHFQTLVLY